MTRAQQLKARREKLGLTQGQLAEKMGYSKYTVAQRHESGERKILDSAWKLYCLVLGMEEISMCKICTNCDFDADATDEE